MSCQSASGLSRHSACGVFQKLGFKIYVTEGTAKFYEKAGVKCEVVNKITETLCARSWSNKFDRDTRLVICLRSKCRGSVRWNPRRRGATSPECAFDAFGVYGCGSPIKIRKRIFAGFTLRITGCPYPHIQHQGAAAG